jgi:hypothetical protein
MIHADDRLDVELADLCDDRIGISLQYGQEAQVLILLFVCTTGPVFSLQRQHFATASVQWRCDTIHGAAVRVVAGSTVD